MQQFITDGQTLKELEAELFSMLQKTYGEMFQQVLEWLDEEIAKQRDKKRYYLKDKRTVRIQTLFGEVEIRRNDYLDREKGDEARRNKGSRVGAREYPLFRSFVRNAYLSSVKSIERVLKKAKTVHASRMRGLENAYINQVI
ncbi:UPF0236 family transposase-like protein [Aeribacillus alveayuensis]|uniref:Transposase n=1 Tax=Aeribacillus alveayuensis TaxID=279215 RepID=A0ABT9VQZ0_9BACI|nr:hypothetical protein [Bacillus alveayuensis]